jgi:hypothetical protein
MNFLRQFPSQIFWKSKFESNQIKNTSVIHQNFFQKVVSAILYLLSSKLFVKKIIKKCIFHGNFFIFLPFSWIPNTDPDPQSHWIRIQSGSGSTTLVWSKRTCSRKGTVVTWDLSHDTKNITQSCATIPLKQCTNPTGRKATVKCWILPKWKVWPLKELKKRLEKWDRLYKEKLLAHELKR